jgi:hypothetical protein
MDEAYISIERTLSPRLDYSDNTPVVSRKVSIFKKAKSDFQPILLSGKRIKT